MEEMRPRKMHYGMYGADVGIGIEDAMLAFNG
jgi:hypothetical protein